MSDSETMTGKIVKSDSEWRKELTPMQYAVLREKATERPFSGEYEHEQTPGTYEKYFAGHSGLVLLAIDAAALGPALKWEPSRGGALFTNLYGDLPLALVRWSRPLASISDLRQLGQ